jgi:hypothetical protein
VEDLSTKALRRKVHKKGLSHWPCLKARMRDSSGRAASATLGARARTGADSPTLGRVSASEHDRGACPNIFQIEAAYEQKI